MMAYTTLLSHVFLQDLFKLIYKKKKNLMTYALPLFYSYNNKVMDVFADHLAKWFSIYGCHT